MGFFIFASVEIILFIINSCLDFSKEKQKKISLGLMFLIMFVFAALRGSGDGDYYNYLWFTRDIGTDMSKVFNFSYPVEFSFRLISYFINSLGISRQWVIVLMNLLSILPTFYITAKESVNPFLSVLIFLPIFIQFDMQTSRSATAIGLGFMAIYQNSKRNYLLSFLFFILALSFHSSSVILGPFLLLMHFDLGRAFKIFTVGLAFIISVFSKLMLSILSKLLTAMGLGRMGLKIISYTFEGRFASSMSFMDPRIVFAFLLFLTSLMYYNKTNIKKLSIEDTSIKAIWFSLVVYLLFRSSTAIAFRFATFFSILQMLYIPMVIKDIRKIDRLGAFLIGLSILLFVIPYFIYLLIEAPAYDFFFTNLNAITSLTN
ncbi:MAG: EpsG family protein [Peptoniphilaceae bacterium]|nr:EpsG family protein [Peptoniphilaceae bacterium]MDY6018721.1 EpsG family protein [Anaerococcus sp.]